MGEAMPKYLITASYNANGVKGLMKAGGSSRVAAVEKALAGLGGTIESFHFAFGSNDVYVIADLPDHASAAAMAATVGSSGSMSRYETVVLLTPEEIDAAGRLTVEYAPPGS
jgi:uncharacterized protein with GYD domain